MTSPRTDPRPAARYGPTDRYDPAPAGGMCLSVFVHARRGSRSLVGRPAPDPAWDWWMPSWRHLGPEERAPVLVPGTYLREGEAPDAGARRVLRDMLRAGAVATPKILISEPPPSSCMEGKPPPRGRTVEGILARVTPPDVAPRLADLVKRPTPRGYARTKRATPEERLRESFALTAFAHNLGERAREARA